jgi:hypothetical protein
LFSDFYFFFFFFFLPELYQHLDETPFFTSAYRERIGSNSLEEYLNTIRSQLKNYKVKK